MHVLPSNPFVDVQVHINMLALYSDPSIDILLDPETRILHANWKGYQSINTGTQGCLHLLEIMSAHKAFRILNDNTDVRGLWMGAAEWAAKEWFPRMKEAGMERFAWVYSPTKFSQISADTAIALMNPDAYGIQIFHGRKDALDWLMQDS